jgi:hypothetical protein
MSDKIALLKRLHEAAKKGKESVKKAEEVYNERMQKQKEQEQLNKWQEEAKKIVDRALTEEELFASANTGVTHYCIKPMDSYIPPEKLTGLQKCIFEEIAKHGFTPLVITDTEEDFDFFYIGIQWRDV